MRNLFASLTVFLIVGVAVSSSALAQAQRPATPAKASAPAPARDLNGVWAGPVQARMNTSAGYDGIGTKAIQR